MILNGFIGDGIIKYYTGWEMPNLTGDYSHGITVTDNHNKGGPAWKACATSSGYTSGYYTGRYANQSSTTLHLYITLDEARIIDSYTYYTASVNSNSDWNTAWYSGGLYASTDGGTTWTALHTHGKINRLTTFIANFNNSTPYTHYRYSIKSTGAGHKDQVNISSFHLLSNIREVTEDDDYDFTIVTYETNGIKLNNKYYMVK